MQRKNSHLNEGKNKVKSKCDIMRLQPRQSYITTYLVQTTCRAARPKTSVIHDLAKLLKFAELNFTEISHKKITILHTGTFFKAWIP